MARNTDPVCKMCRREQMKLFLKGDRCFSNKCPIERESLPDCLEVTAWTDDGEIMGVRHKEFQIEGVQFHPESILSEHGHALLKNFLTA